MDQKTAYGRRPKKSSSSQRSIRGGIVARYVDGYVIPIKKKNVGKYKKMALMGRKAWMKHGALDYYECVGAKLTSAWGLPFAKMCKLKPDETAIFAFIVYKSKAQRDRVNKKVHAEFAKLGENYEMPFDMKRLAMGEFKTLVHS